MILKFYLLLCTLLAIASKELKDLEGMRARELQKFLISKAAMDPTEVKNILDRKVLKQLAMEYLMDEKQEEVRKVNFARMYKTAITVICILFAVLFRDILSALFLGLAGWFSGIFYRFSSTLKLIRTSLKHYLFLSSFYLIVAAAIEVFLAWVQLSVLVGWVTPHGHFLRKYSPKLFSVAVNSNMILPTGSSKSPGFGLDIGPMITMWILGWIKSKLETYGSAYLVNILQERERKKEAKRMKKMQESIFQDLSLDPDDLQSSQSNGIEEIEIPFTEESHTSEIEVPCNEESHTTNKCPSNSSYELDEIDG